MKSVTIKTLSISALALLALFCSTLTAGPSMPAMNKLEEANSLKDAFETPHTKWAKPYANGKVRVLFLALMSANINVLPLRGPVEIAQRFDIDGDAVLLLEGKGTDYAVMYAGGAGVYGGELGKERLDRLMKNQYDSYVVTGESAFGNIPPDVRKTILRRVKQGGAGLVFLYNLGDKEKPVMTAAREQKSLPKILADLKAKTFLLGKGRVVSYSHRRPIQGLASRNPVHLYGLAHMFGITLQRDLRFEKQGRTILWAAQREPQLKLSVSLRADAFALSELSKNPITIKWNGKGLRSPLSLTGRIRSQSRGFRQLPDLAGLNPAGGTRTFKIPTLPAGEYWVDVIARSDRGVEAWAIKEFEVTIQETIRNVQIDEEWGEAGEPIRGSLQVKTPNRPQRALRVHAVDRYGRVLARQEFRNPAENVKFSLPTDSRMPASLGIEAALVANGREITHGYSLSQYTIPHRKRDQWNSAMWGRLYIDEFLDIAEEALVDAGITSRSETSNVPWWYMTHAGMNYVPDCSSGLYRAPDMGPDYPFINTDNGNHIGGAGSEGCWNDEPAVSQRLKTYLDAEEDYRRHGVLAYSMGDEKTTFGACLHKSCWLLYRDWLKNRYKTIKALNNSWGTKYTSFGQIDPIIDKTALAHLPWETKKGWIYYYANNALSSIGPTSSSQAWTKKWLSYPRYVDRCSFQFWNFANYARRFKESALRIDPQAVIGIEGTRRRLHQDIDALVRQTGWWCFDHEATSTEVVRSIAPAGYMYGNPADSTRFWDGFLRGTNSLFTWRIDNYLTPAMGLGSLKQRMVKSARIVFDGLGTLLNVRSERSKMLHDGIVMLHSFPAVAVSRLGDGPTYGNYHTHDGSGVARKKEERKKRIHKPWHRAIRASGLQFEYVTDGQIERDEFDPSAYKVMILAHCEAISPKEEKAIRDFVANGGTVIADVRPGIFGDRGKARKNGGVLDDLFGVRHLNSVPARMSSGRISGQIDDTKLAVRLRGLYVNPAIRVTKGRVLGIAGKTPICIVNKVGKGRAILLNFTMWSFPNVALRDVPEEAFGFLRGLFAASGAEWPLVLLDEKGQLHRNIEAVRWRTGDGIQVVGINALDNGRWDGSSGGLTQPFGDGKTLVSPRTAKDFDLETPVQATLRLPRPMYIYEMRTGRRSEGPTDNFTIGVRPWWANLLVLSERELNSPVLTASGNVAKRGKVFSLVATIPDAQGAHALKLRALSPDGKNAPWFSRSVMVENGTAKIDLPIAYNEQPGKWTLTATDLYTGESALSSFVVK